MKKLFLSFLASLLILPSLVSAAVTFDVNDLRAVISGDDLVKVNKNILFDAAQSFIPDEDLTVTYEWDFGDGTRLETEEEVVHTYEDAGEYEVTLTVKQGGQEETTRRSVFAYEKLALLLTDVTEKREAINKLVTDARAEGTFINLIESFDSTTAFMSEEALSKKLADQVEILNNTE